MRERIYARLSVPVVRPRVANYRYITDFEYNAEHLSSAHFGDVSVGTKFPNQKVIKKRIVKKNMHHLKNGQPLALLDSWSYLINQGFNRSNNLL